MRALRALLIAGVIAGSAAGCSAGELTGEKCIILANGGNKLCGDDAKAWCESTREFRQGDPTLGIEGDSESQAVCDSL
jgi:hypothetical protein